MRFEALCRVGGRGKGVCRLSGEGGSAMGSAPFLPASGLSLCVSPSLSLTVSLSLSHLLSLACSPSLSLSLYIYIYLSLAPSLALARSLSLSLSLSLYFSQQQVGVDPIAYDYRGISLTRKHPPLGPYRRPTPGGLRES
jgi:hypothetical protein